MRWIHDKIIFNSVNNESRHEMCDMQQHGYKILSIFGKFPVRF